MPTLRSADVASPASILKSKFLKIYTIKKIKPGLTVKHFINKQPVKSVGCLMFCHIYPVMLYEKHVQKLPK